MDLWLILSIIVLLIGIPLWLTARKKDAGPEPQIEEISRDDYDAGSYGTREYNFARDAAKERHKKELAAWQERDKIAGGGRIASRVVLGFGVFLLLMSAWVQVPTNEIGIFTSFGKPVDARPNGFQLKMPWEKVVKFDASRQYMKFNGKANDEDADSDKKVWGCVPVKMDREATACLTVTVGWQLRAGTEAERKQTIELYKAHKTFGRLTENFMKANIQGAAQATYNDVNPLVKEQNPGFSQLSTEMEGHLRSAVKGDVEILSVQITGADYDPATDDAIARMQAEYAKTEQAKQLEETNKAISKANAALVQQGKLTPEVLQAECIKVSKEVGAPPGMCLQGGWGMFGTANK